jgi:hypothetical protein
MLLRRAAYIPHWPLFFCERSRPSSMKWENKKLLALPGLLVVHGVLPSLLLAHALTDGIL